MAISFYGENNYKVIPLNATFNNGFYNAVLPLRINGANIDKAYVFLYKMGSEELDFNPTVKDAKKLIEDVKKHGINLTEAGKEQAEVISNNFNKSLVPYGMAIAKRFEEVDFTLDIFGVLVDIGPGSYTVVLPEDLGSMYLSDYVANHKGEVLQKRNDYYREYRDEYEYYYYYEKEYVEYLEENELYGYHLSYDEYYWQIIHGDLKYYNSVHYVCEEMGIIVDYEIYEDELAWDFSYDYYNVRISSSEFFIKDSEEVEVKEEGNKTTLIYTNKIDYRDICFNFEKTSEKDDIKWFFNFEWKGTGKEYEKIKERVIYNQCTYDPTDNSWYEYCEIERDIYIIPEELKILVEGRATDSKVYYDGEGNKLPSLGEITLDGLLDLFADNKDKICFTGNLKAKDELELDGNLEIVFSHKTTMKDVYTGDCWPELDSFMLDGLFKTRDYKIYGLCSIGFIPGKIGTDDGEIDFSLPKDIEFNGLYENTTEDYFHLDGKLAIEMDYSNGFIPDFSSDGQFETQEKYLQYKVNITGDLHARNYESSALDLSCSRTGYRELDVQFAYFFPVGNYIEGNINIDNSEELNLKAELTNQDNLLLTFELNSNTEKKIGEISNKLDTKIKFAEIVIDDKTGELRVVFLDDTSTSLLP